MALLAGTAAGRSTDGSPLCRTSPGVASSRSTTASSGATKGTTPINPSATNKTTKALLLLEEDLAQFSSPISKKKYSHFLAHDEEIPHSDNKIFLSRGRPRWNVCCLDSLYPPTSAATAVAAASTASSFATNSLLHLSVLPPFTIYEITYVYCTRVCSLWGSANTRLFLRRVAPRTKQSTTAPAGCWTDSIRLYALFNGILKLFPSRLSFTNESKRKIEAYDLQKNRTPSPGRDNVVSRTAVVY